MPNLLTCMAILCSEFSHLVNGRPCRRPHSLRRRRREKEEGHCGEQCGAGAGAAVSPVRLKCSGSIGPAGPESWALRREVAGEFLQTGRGCGCCPSGCGRGRQEAGARAWSPRCSPPGPPRPRPAPEPPGGSAPRPQAGGGCAPSPRRGSPRLGTGAGVRGGDTGPHPLRRAISPGPGRLLCVSPHLSSVSSLSTQTPEEFLREDRAKQTPSFHTFL